MNQIIDWMQSNWYELGSLTAQFTFLFAGLWFAQKILKTMRASQQQFGALLRLSMTDGLEERSKMSEAVHEPAERGDGRHVKPSRRASSRAAHGANAQFCILRGV